MRIESAFPFTPEYFGYFTADISYNPTVNFRIIRQPSGCPHIYDIQTRSLIMFKLQCT